MADDADRKTQTNVYDMAPDEAVRVLSSFCHLLLGYAMAASMDAGKTSDKAWLELKPYRRAIYAATRALGLSTLAPPYVDDEDLPDWHARNPSPKGLHE